MAENDQEDPPRMTSDPDSPPALGALFEHAQRDAPRLDELDRAWGEIARRTGSGGSPPPGRLLTWGAGAIVAVLAIGGAVLWGTGAFRESVAPSESVSVRTSAPPAAVGEPLPSAPRPVAPVVPAQPRAATASPRRSLHTAEPRDVARTPLPAPPPSDELAEGALLLRARRALAGDPALALTLTDEHLRRVPTGRLAPEREVIAIEALGGLGRRADARVRAERFVARWPSSAHRPRVDRWLEHNP